jgi:hypothetical protein
VQTTTGAGSIERITVTTAAVTTVISATAA